MTYKTKSTAKVVVIVIAAVMAAVLILSLIARAVPSEDNISGTQAVESNIKLHYASEGAYLKEIDGQKYVFVNDKTENDYLELNIGSWNLQSFWNSNHTSAVFGFDLITSEDYTLPSMTLTPVLSGDDSDAQRSISKLASAEFTFVDTDKYGVMAAPGVSNSHLVGSYTVGTPYRVKVTLSKVASDESLMNVSISVGDDAANYQFTYDNSKKITVEGFKLAFARNGTGKVSAVKISNFGLTYIPSLEEYPAEEIDYSGATLAYSQFSDNPDIKLYNSASGSGSVANLVSGDAVYGAYTAQYVAAEDVGTAAFISLRLDEDSSVRIDAYDYITIEFDVFNGLTDYDLLECVLILLCRSDILYMTGSAYVPNSTTVSLKSDGGDIYALNQDKSYMTVPGDSVHVKYVFEVNKVDISDSHLQIYLNNELKYDSTDSAFKVFNANQPYLSELRLTSFVSAGVISIDNYSLKCYNNVTND